MRGCDWCFHVAASYHLWLPDYGPMYAANVEGTRKVLTTAAAAGCQRIVYTSTVGCIGLPQKDLFNAAKPTQDGALADYVTNPTFPAILDALFRAPVNATLGTSFATLAPTNFPRNDLVATFLTGILTLNQLKAVTPSEMLRLNTTVTPTPQAGQSPLGVVGNDLAGFPNGRRPGDDTVDVVLRVAMGRLCYPVPIAGKQVDLGLCKPSDAPTGQVAYTDGAPENASMFLNAFPYLNPPLRGAPRPQTQP